MCIYIYIYIWGGIYWGNEKDSGNYYLGFRVQGLGFRDLGVWGLGFRFRGLSVLGLGVEGFGVLSSGSGI